MTPVLLSTRFISQKESWRDLRITNDNCRETIEEAFDIEPTCKDGNPGAISNHLL